MGRVIRATGARIRFGEVMRKAVGLLTRGLLARFSHLYLGFTWWNEELGQSYIWAVSSVIGELGIAP